MVVMIVRAGMLNVTTPLEVLVAIVEMATDTMEHTVTVWTKLCCMQGLMLQFLL